MIFQVTPETRLLLCFFIMAVAFILAQVITAPDPKPEEEFQKYPAPRPVSSH